MRVQQRLTLGFLALVLLITVVGLVGLWAEGHIHRGFSQIVRYNAPEIIVLGEISAAGARRPAWALSLAAERAFAPAAPAQTESGGERETDEQVHDT